MAKILDLNTMEVPVLELTLKNKERTTLRVTAPTEALIQELESMVKSGLGNLEKGDRDSVNEAYDLVARLISCNMEHFPITGQELREKYGVDIWSLIAVVKAYVEFINDIKNEKN